MRVKIYETKFSKSISRKVYIRVNVFKIMLIKRLVLKNTAVTSYAHCIIILM